MSDPLDRHRAAFDARPHDIAARLDAATDLNTLHPEHADPRAAVLKAASDIGALIDGIMYPDRYPTFWTVSEGWTASARQLESLVAVPENTDAFRQQYERLVRGDAHRHARRPQQGAAPGR